MNQVIQAAVCSLFKPVVDPNAVVITEAQLRERARAASVIDLFSNYGRHRRPSTGAQGQLFLIENRSRTSSH